MMHRPHLVLGTLVALVLMAALSPNAALAEDCGFPPEMEPIIPNGETATREEVNLATRAVQAYAAVINAYLDCLDTGRDTAFQNMSADQQERWIEDYDKLVERLSEIELAVNEEIRKYNART